MGWSWDTTIKSENFKNTNIIRLMWEVYKPLWLTSPDIRDGGGDFQAFYSVIKDIHPELLSEAIKGVSEEYITPGFSSFEEYGIDYEPYTNVNGVNKFFDKFFSDKAEIDDAIETITTYPDVELIDYTNSRPVTDEILRGDLAIYDYSFIFNVPGGNSINLTFQAKGEQNILDNIDGYAARARGLGIPFDSYSPVAEDFRYYTDPDDPNFLEGGTHPEEPVEPDPIEEEPEVGIERQNYSKIQVRLQTRDRNTGELNGVLMSFGMFGFPNEEAIKEHVRKMYDANDSRELVDFQDINVEKYTAVMNELGNAEDLQPYVEDPVEPEEPTDNLEDTQDPVEPDPDPIEEEPEVGIPEFGRQNYSSLSVTVQTRKTGTGELGTTTINFGMFGFPDDETIKEHVRKLYDARDDKELVDFKRINVEKYTAAVNERGELYDFQPYVEEPEEPQPDPIEEEPEEPIDDIEDTQDPVDSVDPIEEDPVDQDPDPTDNLEDTQDPVDPVDPDPDPDPVDPDPVDSDPQPQPVLPRVDTATSYTPTVQYLTPIQNRGQGVYTKDMVAYQPQEPEDTMPIIDPGMIQIPAYPTYRSNTGLIYRQPATTGSTQVLNPPTGFEMHSLRLGKTIPLSSTDNLEQTQEGFKNDDQ